MENYYNVRDKNGRFTSKGKKTTVKKKVKKATNKNLAIYDMFILDKSSSMNSIKQATMNGFNELIGGIKKVYEDTKVPSYCSLIEFSSYGTIKDTYLNTPCVEVGTLNDYNYRPGGMTALYDAIGHGIHQMTEYLGDNIDNKDISVTISILTDGEENNSRNYNQQDIKNLIEKMKTVYNWTINYIGSGSEKSVKAVADSIGIFASNSMNYMATDIGTQNVFKNITRARSVRSTSYVSTGVVKNDGFFSND